MKRPWLAALLNLWPLPLGIGYLYLKQWGRFVIAVLGLQIVGMTVVRLTFGTQEARNIFAAIATVAVIVDAYLVARRMNEALQVGPPAPPPEVQEDRPAPQPTAAQETEMARPSPESRRWGLPVLLAVALSALVIGATFTALLTNVFRPPAPTPVHTVLAPPTNTPSPPPTATLPPASTSEPALIIYTVQPGDSLTTIAGRFGTTVDAIIALNGLVSTTIHSGTRLRIPSSGYSIPASPHATELPAPPPTATSHSTGATPDDEYIACLGQVADLSEQLNQQLDAAWASGDDRETFCQSWLSYNLLETAQSAQQLHNACAAPQHSDIIEARGHLDRALEYRVASIEVIIDWCIAGSMEDMEAAFEESERYMQLANEFIDKATSAMRGS